VTDHAVTNTNDPLAVASVAGAIAPIIDRLRIGIATRMRAGTVELALAAGLGMEGGRTFAMLRNTHEARPVVIDDLRAVFTYMPPDAVQAGIDELVEAGFVDCEDTTLALSNSGRELMAKFVAVSGDVTQELWGAAPSIEHLAGLTSRVFEEAKATAGPTFGVVAPFEPPADAPVPSRLAEHLTALRFHRYDCHIAAWRDAGLSAAEVAALSDGPQRDAIEATTNRCAGVPYAAITERERFELVAGLGSLSS
jgi:hypothetical protein